jgi:hypothetical protein
LVKELFAAGSFLPTSPAPYKSGWYKSTPFAECQEKIWIGEKKPSKGLMGG